MSETLNPFAVSIPSVPTPMAVGPRGGSPDAPALNPEARKAGYNGSESRFHNSRPTNSSFHGLEKEKPWHRMAAYMLCAGRTNAEIAIAADVEPGTVSMLRANRWFQELCATISNQEGGEIVGAINSEALASIEVIRSIRDDGDCPARVRLTAATTLLEQAHGKPTQKIIASRGPNVLSPAEEMAELDRELNAIRGKVV